MKMYIFSLAALAMLMGAIQVKAQNFDDYFVDKTLRVDYTFAGNSNKQLIAVDELNVLPRWYGKKQRLSELPWSNHRTRPPFGQSDIPQFVLYPFSGMALLSRGQDQYTEFRECLLGTNAKRYS